MRTESDSLAILEEVLKAAGADEADASLMEVDQNISRFANSQIHQNMSEESDSLTLRVAYSLCGMTDGAALTGGDKGGSADIPTTPFSSGPAPSERS